MWHVAPLKNYHRLWWFNVDMIMWITNDLNSHGAITWSYGAKIKKVLMLVQFLVIWNLEKGQMVILIYFPMGKPLTCKPKMMWLVVILTQPLGPLTYYKYKRSSISLKHTIIQAFIQKDQLFFVRSSIKCILLVEHIDIKLAMMEQYCRRYIDIDIFEFFTTNNEGRLM